MAFVQQKNVLYRGVAPVVGGRFEYTFMVPRDVAYQYAPGKLSHYAVSGYEHAAGSYKRLYFGGLNEEVVISETRPQIELYLGDESFRNGGLTDQSPLLVAHLFDSVGINASASMIWRPSPSPTIWPTGQASIPFPWGPMWAS